jgi:phosphomannomutase/phosphoglucomutase
LAHARIQKSDYMGLFGTNGVRGRFFELDPEKALRVSQAIGTYFNRGKIIVARDGRLTGEVLRNAVCSGLMSVGCKVLDLGFASSPTAEFMVRKLGADGLIIITASHNPPEWNALKVVDGKGIAVSKERGAEIEKMMDRIEPASWDKVGTLEKTGTAEDDHVLAIKKEIDSEIIQKKKPKVVLDCANGMAALIAPRLLEEIGAQVITINSLVDGRFPGRPSEPSETNVSKMLAMVKKENADAGIAWDGDGDRVIFADENGNYIIGDKVFVLCLIWELAEKKGSVVTTVATSKAAEDIAAKNGCKTIYTKIGAPYLSEEMAKGTHVMGGEEVGGVIWPDLSLAKDGMITAAKMVEKICEKPLSEWAEEIPEYHNVKTKIEADQSKKTELVEKMLNYAKENNLDYLDIDGVRINLPDGWVIVRASGTEDYVRVFAEAKTGKRADEILKQYLVLLDES